MGTGTGCPSSARESAVGTIPSESFDIRGNVMAGNDNLAPGQTPEPSSIMLLGSGMLGLAGILRRRLMG